MPTPSFSPKVNKRPAGFEELISNEPHTVPVSFPYVIRLIEVPNYNPPVETISIPGYEMTTASPGPGQFQVNLIDGRITFHSSAAGADVVVTYFGLGSEVDALDINEVQDVITKLTQPLYFGRLTQAESDILVASLDFSAGGVMWFNGDSEQFEGWNGHNRIIVA